MLDEPALIVRTQGNADVIGQAPRRIPCLVPIGA
jgi:hypothetical protein